jgi:hypothetical protein
MNKEVKEPKYFLQIVSKTRLLRRTENGRKVKITEAF